MLKHIVMWKFRDEAMGRTKERNISEAKRMIGDLKGEIESIVDLELGINEEGLTGNFDLVLYSVFKDEEGLEYYQKHYKHVPLIDYMKEVTYERACVDYIY